MQKPDSRTLNILFPSVGLVTALIRPEGVFLAGLIPLYSQWGSVDAWGLNDQRIAHEGGIPKVYLEEIDPEIIMFHGYFSPPAPQGSGDWFEMVIKLKEYAEEHGYQLAAVYGDSPNDTHYSYVHTDSYVHTGFAYSEEIGERIGNAEYYWFYSGKLAISWIGENLTNP